MSDNGDPAPRLDFDPESVTWVLTTADLGFLLEAIRACIEVVEDLETTGLDEHATGQPHRNGGVPARVVLGSLTLPQADDEPFQPTTWVVPLSHPDSPFLGRWRTVLRQISEVIAEEKKPLINQNMKFDARWVEAHTGVDLSHLITWDTRIGSHLLDENSSTKLKERAPATFGVTRWDDFDLTIPGAAEAVPLFDLGMYAARDTYWTWRLAEHQRVRMFLHDQSSYPPIHDEEIEEARLGRLAVWCAMPTVATLTAVEQRGMHLDVEWTQRELAEHQQAAEEIAAKMADKYVSWGGPDPEDFSFAPTSHWFRDWTEVAVQMGDLTVAELTPTGRPRWAKGVLIRQAREGSEVAQAILDHRGHTKKSEYLTSWLLYVDADGRVHATYNSGSVVTGRLSSSEPNMQQVTSSLRPAWVPRPGFVFADFDYSQIEMRMAAHIAHCIPMIQAFQRGDDLHRLLAQQITRRELVTPDERQKGKAGNFGFLFGMGAYGFRTYAEENYGVVMGNDEAHAVHRTFFETWEGLAAWHARAVSRAHQTGQVSSPLGRVRRLPGIWDGNETLVADAERQAINSPVQGMASDIMQIAAASIEGNLPWAMEPVENARIVATVHDNIVVEVPADGWQPVVEECLDRMLNLEWVLAKLECHLSVPLAVQVKVGTRWGLADVATIG